MVKSRIRELVQPWLITRPIAFTLLSLAVSSLASCSETKVSRCNALISVANRATQDIQSLPGQTLQPKERFTKAADILDRASRDVSALKIQDATVQKLQTQLVDLYGRDRDHNQVLATSNNAKAIRESLQSLQKNDLQQRSIVKAANTYCQTVENP